MVEASEKGGRRPPSEGLFGLSLAGVGLSVLFLTAVTFAGWPIFYRALGAIAVYGLPQIAFELVRNRRQIRASYNVEIDHVVRVKLVALAAALLAIFGGFRALGAVGLTKYQPAELLLGPAMPLLLLLAIPYFCTVGRMQREPRDDYYEVGRLLMGRVSGADWKRVRHFAAGWFIKAFFFPLMFTELLHSVIAFERSISSPAGLTYWYAVSVSLIYFIDVCIASAGYLATLRIFGWQIRSSNPYPMAWAVTLLCYYPFFGPMYRQLLDYKDGYLWSDWLASSPILLTCWAVAIFALKVSWILAISPFGLRFSNLTNRGIITNGTFALTKHPSYVSKNLFWWMIHIPFLSMAAGMDAVTNCLQLLAIGAIYFIRARYEERHLSEEPRYVAYAMWIEQHGIFRGLGRLVPALRYRPPAPTAPPEAGLPQPQVAAS